MLRTVLTLALALAASTSLADRQYEVVGNVGVYELTLHDVIMPNGAGGTTIFKLCANCDTIALPVQGSTLYSIRNNALALQDFLAAVEEVRAATNGAAGVGVFYDLQTNRVTRITVYPPR